MNPKILITICARGGSKGIPGKNTRRLNGKPLIAHTVEQALDWRYAEDVVVSTDSSEIALVAEQFGAKVPFIRPADLAEDRTPKLEAIRHALVESENAYQKKYDIIVDLDATSPMRSRDDLENCLNLFLEKRPKSLFSVVKARKNPYFNMVELNQDGFAALSKKCGEVGSRQVAPEVYEMNASIYFYRRDYLLDSNSVSAISDQSVVYEMNETSRYDIDEELDFEIIEYLMKRESRVYEKSI